MDFCLGLRVMGAFRVCKAFSNVLRRVSSKT